MVQAYRDIEVVAYIIQTCLKRFEGLSRRLPTLFVERIAARIDVDVERLVPREPYGHPDAFEHGLELVRGHGREVDIELSGAVNGEPSALLHHSEDNGLHLVVGDEGEVHVEPSGLGVDGKATAGADERIDGYGYGRGAALRVTSSTGTKSGLKSHFPAWQSLSIRAGRLIAHPFQGDSTAKTDSWPQ